MYTYTKDRQNNAYPRSRKEIDMAIIKNGEVTYEGQVITIREHMWMDGMVDVYAKVWDMEAHELKSIQVGYYGADGRNLYGSSYAKPDLSTEAKRDMYRTLKRNDALAAYQRSVIATKTAITKGTHAEVVRGRKVAKGTKVEVFWVGEKETYRSRQYAWMSEYETIAGCYDEDGNKIWIKVEYLKNIDPIKSPRASERKKFIKAYTKDAMRQMGVR